MLILFDSLGTKKMGELYLVLGTGLKVKWLANMEDTYIRVLMKTWKHLGFKCL